MANLQGKRPSRLMTVPTGPLPVSRSPACGWLIKLASPHSAKSFRDSFWLLAFGGALALPTSTPIPSDQGSVRNPVTLATFVLGFRSATRSLRRIDGVYASQYDEDTSCPPKQHLQYHPKGSFLELPPGATCASRTQCPTEEAWAKIHSWACLSMV